MKTSYILKHLTGSFFFFFILFISAGRIDYWQGLAYVIVGLLMFSLNYSILKPGSELLDERTKPGQDVKKWDKVLLGLLFILTIAMYIIAGLDSGRYNWSPHFSWKLYIPGIILTATGQIFFLIAQKQNKFFSSMVRIQTERGHSVCQTGLYKLVRHPAYLGSVMQLIGFPLFFGSIWSIIPVALLIIIHLIRTQLEDKTLMAELTGYAEYSDQTRYKLIPYIW